MLQFPHTIGQAFAKRQIAGAVESNKVAHAYLVQGPEGSGLFALALDMGMMLLCSGEPRPCLECASCRKLLNNAHPDFQVYHPFPSADVLKMTEEAYADFKRESISQIVAHPYSRLSFEREARYAIGAMREMQENLEIGKTEKTRRVAVLNEADLMGEEAANSLLKTLEEPQGGVVLLLLSSRPSRLLPTLVSRCQTIRLGPLQPQELAAVLQREKPASSPGEMELAVRLANGNASRALEFLEGELNQAYGLAQKWIRLSAADDLEGALELVEELLAKSDTGFLVKVLEIVLIMVRDACILAGETSPIPPWRAEKHVEAVQKVRTGLEGNAIANILLLTSIRRLQKETIE